MFDNLIAGTTVGEFALVAFIFAMVLLAPKIPRVGEAVGRLFVSDRESDS